MVWAGILFGHFPSSRSKEEQEKFMKDLMKNETLWFPTRENPGYEDPLLLELLEKNNISKEEYEEMIEEDEDMFDKSSSNSD